MSNQAKHISGSDPLTHVYTDDAEIARLRARLAEAEKVIEAWDDYVAEWTFDDTEGERDPDAASRAFSISRELTRRWRERT